MKKVNIMFFIIANIAFSQSIFFDDEKIEKKYLLEEYEAIREEIQEKIIYIRKKPKQDTEIYRDILLKYEELEKELLKDIDKVKGEFKNV